MRALDHTRETVRVRGVRREAFCEERENRVAAGGGRLASKRRAIGLEANAPAARVDIGGPILA